ncbi:MAG: DUF2807 domain-containing protein [Dehalococcoidia bacterium]
MTHVATRFAALLAAVVVTASMAACGEINVSIGNSETIDGSGVLASETYDLTDFDTVEVSNAFAVSVTAAESYEVVVTADDNLLESLEVEVRGSTLVIGLAPDVRANDATLGASVAMPALVGVTASGASRVSFTGFGVVDRFDVEISGASRVDGAIDAGLLVAELSGATRVQLAGTATEARLEASGASSFELADLEIQTAEVHLSGASNADLVVLEELGPVELSGASELVFGGGATLRDVESSGGSRLSER